VAQAPGVKGAPFCSSGLPLLSVSSTVMNNVGRIGKKRGKSVSRIRANIVKTSLIFDTPPLPHSASVDDPWGRNECNTDNYVPGDGNISNTAITLGKRETIAMCNNEPGVWRRFFNFFVVGPLKTNTGKTGFFSETRRTCRAFSRRRFQFESVRTGEYGKNGVGEFVFIRGREGQGPRL